MNKPLVSFAVLCLFVGAFLFGSIHMPNVVDAASIDPATFRDNTLLCDGNNLEIVDGNKNIVWTMNTGLLNDIEMMPNGNILASKGGMTGTSYVEVINMTTKTVVWNITSVGGKALKFTHDTDWIGQDQSGQDIFLTADTGNDRVVEFTADGTVLWTWNTADHYDKNVYKTNGTDWTHLNDVDRLADGTTMICLHNFDIIIIVNTTTAGEILWQYGSFGDTSIINNQHNPVLLPDNKMLICDSGNYRIIKIDTITKQVLWQYAPASGSDTFLGWPRDVNLLPNGNLVICDSVALSGGVGKNRIWEINPNANNQVVWYFDTSQTEYDCERLDTVMPYVDIQSPVNGSVYNPVSAIAVNLTNEDPWYDSMFYRIHDDTAGTWLTSDNVTYTGLTQVSVQDQHNYTLYAWGLDAYTEDGAAPTPASAIQLETSTVQFSAEGLTTPSSSASESSSATPTSTSNLSSSGIFQTALIVAAVVLSAVAAVVVVLYFRKSRK